MTTGPEIIAAAIRDGLHELAEAIASRETPRMGPRSDEQAEGVHKDPPSVQGAVEPAEPAMERAARIIRDWERDPDANWSAAAQALADAGLLATPRPMTVGQLSAEHIGKRVSIAGDRPVLIGRIHHVDRDWTWIDHDRNHPAGHPDGGRTSGHPDTPCELLDDEARR